MMWPQLRRRELKVDRKLNLGVGVDVKNRGSESTTERLCAKLVFFFLFSFFLVPHSSAATCNNHSSFIAWWWMGRANNMRADNEKQMVKPLNLHFWLKEKRKKKKKSAALVSFKTYQSPLYVPAATERPNFRHRRGPPAFYLRIGCFLRM